MAAAMGFSSFGAQHPSSKKRKYNPNNDAVVSIDDPQRHGTGPNSAPVGERRRPAANADEIALDDDDNDDGGGGGGGVTAATGAIDTASSSGGTPQLSHSTGGGVAGLPQRPAPGHGGFPGNQHRRGGAPRQGPGGHHGTNKLWYQDYYDHFSNENPWARLEQAAGLQPISTWTLIHTDREEAPRTQAA
ncbi:hypothetical protein V2A60_009848 [Cordyceps javanica]|uniref:Uncharacterized protein n=1 Tax=Cordyceps javanica TaxID=43265 RepID=A0A545V042_9HYPO|nr:hypothetical protein IF1G_06065 [Cordyceps javanica]TQW05714.1 hypothetical protein IF2G_06836 [Cordyceps javanica]